MKELSKVSKPYGMKSLGKCPHSADYVSKAAWHSSDGHRNLNSKQELMSAGRSCTNAQ